eukprot:5354718-Alexandrium_andersonii.AAC.1
MSASLVGSEMCIRDSQEAWAASRRWGAAWDYFTAALTERGPPTPQELLQAAINNPAVSEWRKRQLEGTATTHGP